MLIKRPRRNRKSQSIRSLIEENTLLPSDLVAPFFVVDGNEKIPIPSLPGIEKHSINHLLKAAEELHAKGILAVALFPVVGKEHKDSEGKTALHEEGLIPKAIKALKKEIPSLCVITDIALDPFTSHGHDGVLGPDGDVHNDRSVEILAKMALLHARCGADVVAPSDMMDGRVGAIRALLDQEQYHNVNILSYSAKYVSSLYAPYRDALGSFMSGDKKTYQLSPRNIREALLEAKLDEEEGADMLLVKPAIFYLDVIAKLRANTHLPICAFHVSGEYSMVMAAHERGFLDATRVFQEALMSIKRAGADFIISYATSMILPHL